MKKVLCVLIVSVFLGTMLFASGATERKLDVWVWNGDGGYALAYRDAIANFNAKYPNVPVTINVISYSEFGAALKAAIVGDKAPDIMQVPVNMITDLAESGAVLPLSNYFVAEDFPKFYDATVSKLQYEGEDYMAPFNVISYNVGYNKAIFDKLGLKVPMTIDELMTISNTLKDNGYYGIAVGTKDKWVGANLIYNQNIYLDESHELITKAELGKIKFSETKLAEAADIVSGYVKAGLFAPGANSMDAFVGAQNLFEQGKAAMFYPVGTFDSDSILKGIGGAFEIGIFPFPAPNAKKAVAMGAMGLNFAVSSGSKNKDLAVEFLRYFYTDSAANAIYEAGMIPSFPYTYTGSKKTTDLFARLLEVQHDAILDLPFNSAVSSAAYTASQGIMDGTLDGAGFVEALQKAYDMQK